MSHAYFFGYGSLVNAATHDYAPVYQAKASGWKRAWRYTSDRKLAFLTAVRDENSEIDGLIAPVPGNDWGALDERERAYERHASVHQITHGSDARDIAIYAIDPDRSAAPTEDHPILLSYLDVVIQGYLRVFGLDGVTHFLETTEGWEAPILDDRASPIYPRAQRIGAGERAVVDDLLGQIGSRRIQQA
ncbi:MAG: gamma-glutamylcyclotransferase [Pelagimonas sp.]|jgi:hypothetical protein|nr:gamma-glutamylcyclotransferase [Pelagimonas sp.]